MSEEPTGDELAAWLRGIADEWERKGKHPPAVRRARCAANRIAELEEQIDVLEGMNASRAGRIADLEAAIRQHRDLYYGPSYHPGDGGNPDDDVLYEALRGTDE